MKFKKIYIEITNKCNLNCSFCSKSNRKLHEMTFDEFKIVLDKVRNYTDSVYLHVKGEPLLHSKLSEILTYCDNNKVVVKITTNGTLLKNKYDVLKSHRIKQINVSLHCENNFKNYYDDVFDICDKLSKKTAIVYRIWTLDNNEFSKISTNIVHKLIDRYKLSPEIVDKIYMDKNIKIIDNIYLDKENIFEWPIEGSKNSDFGTCLGTKSHIAILSNGVVVPCCLDSDGIINLGNIYENDLEDIINGKLYQTISNGFKNNLIYHNLCQSCTYRLKFNK